MTTCYTYEDCKRARLRVDGAAAIRECKRHGMVAWVSSGGSCLTIAIPEVSRDGTEGVFKARIKAGSDGLFLSTSILDALGY